MYEKTYHWTYHEFKHNNDLDRWEHFVYFRDSDRQDGHWLSLSDNLLCWIGRSLVQNEILGTKRGKGSTSFTLSDASVASLNWSHTWIQNVDCGGA